MDSAPSSGSPQRHGIGEKQGHIRQRNASLDDDYMMYTYKVIPCSRVSTHNWKLCHFSHVGEVAARRRSPSCHQADLCAWVSANKECPNGDKCTFAHNAFESWLHPDRFKTTLCSYAGTCTRKFCFFAHCTSELRIPSKQSLPLDPLLSKPTSLDISSATGSPNSSSSNNSSSKILAQLRPAWTAPTDAALLNSTGGLYLNSPHNGTGIFNNNSSTACTLSAAAGAQTLPSLVVTQPQLPAAAAAAGGGGPAALSVTVPGIAAVGAAAVSSFGVPYWDGASVRRLGSTHIGSDSSCQSGHMLFDTATTPSSTLTVASISPNQSPVFARDFPASSSTTTNNNNGGGSCLLPALALPGIDCSQQQDSNLRQQLLQHLASLQQQQHQRQQQQQQQQQQFLLNQCNQAWSLGPRGGSNPPAPSLGSMNPISRPIMNPSLGTAALPAAAAAVSAGTWPASFSLVSLQAHEQQQQQQLTLGIQHPPGLSMCQGPAANHQSGLDTSAGFNLAVVQNRYGTGRYQTAGDAGQLQQQFNMLSFAMPQPA